MRRDEAIFYVRALFLKMISEHAADGKGGLPPGIYAYARNAPRGIEGAALLLQGDGPEGTPLRGPRLELGVERAALLEDGTPGGFRDDPLSGDMTLSFLDRLAQTAGGRTGRRARGSFYTAPSVVRFMVHGAFLSHRKLTDGREQPFPSFRILDPACGTGAFLLGALDFLRRSFPVSSIATLISERLFGIDSDPLAVAVCSLRLWALALRSGEPGPRFRVNVVEGDSLLGYPPSGLLEGRMRGEDGFDVVLANPPYIRQEDIPSEMKTLLGRLYPGFSRRSDVYVYFLAAVERMLNNDGVAAVICPNTWMNVGYGGPVCDYLLERFRVRAVVQSSVERWFPSADVDACIIFLEKGSRPAPCGPAPVIRLTMLDRPISMVVPGDDAGTRVVSVTAENLRRYRGKWGRLFDLPGVLERVLTHGGGRLCFLGDLARVRRGFTTGANGFFYMRDLGNAGAGLRRVQPIGAAGVAFDVPETMLKPLIKSPRDIRGYRIRDDELRFRVLMLDRGILEQGCDDRNPTGADAGGVRCLIRWGEAKGYHAKPTCASRDPWWFLRGAEPPPLVWAMTLRDRFFVALNRAGLPDARLYGIYPFEGVDLTALAGVLNSTFTALQAEWGCRTYGGGGGPLDTKVYEVKCIRVPDLRIIPASESRALVAAYLEMASREVFELERELAMEDRRALDTAYLSLLGVDGSEARGILDEAYEVLLRRVRLRTARAKTCLADHQSAARRDG